MINKLRQLTTVIFFTLLISITLYCVIVLVILIENLITDKGHVNSILFWFFIQCIGLLVVGWSDNYLYERQNKFGEKEI